jgi:hypothetical protein
MVYKRWNVFFRSDFLLLLFLAFSLSLNVFLGWKIKSANVPPEEARVGMVIPALQVISVSGAVSELKISKEHTTIFYIFRPGCMWCAANLDNIRAFSQQDGAKVNFVGISTTQEGLKDYLTKNPLPFPSYVLSEPPKLSIFDVAGTPQTVEVSSSGKVQHNWIGAYRPEIAASIAGRFHLKLPGLIKIK